MVPIGKQAMVWKLRNWCAGSPAAQVAEAQRLGLSRVSIKITDGKVEKWESGSRTNKDLLPATTLALQSAGIEVDGWAWMKGHATQWDWTRMRYVRCTPAEEARATVDVCHRLHLEHLQADAEKDYRGSGKVAWAEEWCGAAVAAGPEIFLSLCSYRFPLSNQADFPVRTFAPYMDGWSPQVYFLGDNRAEGGAIQLESSSREYARVRTLPYIGVAPTYQAAGPWRATPAQLAAFFRRAVELGHAGVSVWALELATEAQKQALADFAWDVIPPAVDRWQVAVASNLRTGPGVSFPVIRLLDANTIVERLEVGGGVGGDWWRVQVGTLVGWLWAPSWKTVDI